MYFQAPSSTAHAFPVVSSVSAVTPSSLPGRANPVTISIIVDGGVGFDRKAVERLIKVPGFKASIIDCSELVGANRVERGLALLDEIRRRKASGEISGGIPAGIFLHACVKNGELMLSDEHDSFSLPAAVLFHAMASDATPSTSCAAAQPAPVLLSCCKAAEFAKSLGNYPRPVLISGGEYNVYGPDANAVMIRFVQEAQLARLNGKALDTDRLFDVISHTSGEPLHRIEGAHWETHDVLTSVTSLDEIDARQEFFYLCAVLCNGTVDDFAEAVLLFGMEPLRRRFNQAPKGGQAPEPVLWQLVLRNTRDLMAKLVLLLALGEDIEQKNRKGNTLLHDACKWRMDDDDETIGNVELAEVLLANGASIYSKNARGLMPTDLAQASGNDDLNALLFSDRSSHARPELRPAGLHALARQCGWGSVVSLLTELGVARPEDKAAKPQAMDLSDS